MRRSSLRRRFHFRPVLCGEVKLGGGYVFFKMRDL